MGFSTWFRRDRPLYARLVRALVVFLLAVLALEVAAALILGISAPERLRRAARVHALMGTRDLHRYRPEELRAPFHPLIGWHPRGAYKPHPNRSEDGLVPNRAEDTSAIDPSADVRIYVVGGASVAGLDLPRHETIPARMERFLEARHEQNFNVVNAGVEGWYSVHTLAYLTQELFPFHEPDMIFVVGGYPDSLRAAVAARKFRKTEGGWWDSESNYLYDPRLQWYLDTITTIQKDAGYVFEQLLYTLGLSPYVDHRRYFLGALLTSTHYPPVPRGVDEIERGVQRPPESCDTPSLNVHPFLENVQSSLGAARAWDTPMVYVLEPSLVFKTPRSEREKRLLHAADRWLFRNGYPRYDIPEETCWSRFQREFYRRVQTRIDRSSFSANVAEKEVADLSRLFSNHETTVYRTPLSYTAAGRRTLARKLAGIAESRLSLPGGTSEPAPASKNASP